MSASGRRFVIENTGVELIGMLAAFCMGACVMGCGAGGGGSSGAPVYPVAGVVKLKGQPVAGADIVFHLKDGSGSSFGRTDSTGRYELTTRQSNDGAPPGDYLVGISKTDDAPAQTYVLQEDTKNYNPYVGKNPAPQPKPKSSISPNLADPKTSGLTARVNADKNTIDFDLN